MEVVRHVQSIQNSKLIIFLQYIKKSIATAFVFYCDAKYSVFYVGPVMFVVTCYLSALVRSKVVVFNASFNEIICGHQPSNAGSNTPVMQQILQG